MALHRTRELKCRCHHSTGMSAALDHHHAMAAAQVQLVQALNDAKVQVRLQQVQVHRQNLC